MTMFLAISAVLVIGALLFVLPPLLSRKDNKSIARSAVNTAVYRDQLHELESDLAAGTLSQDNYENARRELEARLLQDVATADAPAPAAAKGHRVAIAAGIAVPLVAGLLYFLVGTPQALSPEALAGKDPSHPMDEQQIVAMVERLADRMKQNPDDAEGWAMLARSYSVIGRFNDATRAYGEAVRRIPNNAQLYADYADALAMAQGRNLRGEPEKLIARALQIDPTNVKALALAGTVAFDKKDYASAVAHWQGILKVAPPDSEIARSVNSSIAEAQALAAGGAAPAQRQQAAAASPQKSAALTGVVKLAPELASKVAPNDTVFIYARAAEGPRAPLAVMRKAARELPAKFTLDDSMAMAPNMKLSSFDRVIVAARVSKTGNAAPQPGDLHGTSVAVANSANDVSVVIDSEVR
jgi:cytochrome c-type biogenesis protein CcmH